MQKVIFIIILIFCSIRLFAQENDNYLIRIHPGDNYELGDKCGYMSMDGDTIVPFGKYKVCYTDTLKYFAIVLVDERNLIAIDKKGNKLFRVFWFDNGPDYPQEGLFRIIKDNKIGYANLKGEVVIEPIYKCAYPFRDGKAKVANKCESVKDGEYKRWESDNWFFIDREGNIVY